MIMTRLKELTFGDTATVRGYCEEENGYRRKLLDMGLTPGTRLTIKRIAPLGDPIEIVLRGFLLLLRKREADAVVVEKQP